MRTNSIIPRSIGVLGYAQCLLKEVCLHTQEQIIHIVCMALVDHTTEGIFGKRNNMITNNQANDVDEDDVVKATTDSIVF